MPKHFKKRKKKTNICAYFGVKQNFPQNSVFISFFKNLVKYFIVPNFFKKTSEQIPNNNGFRQTDARKLSNEPLINQFSRYITVAHQRRTTRNNRFHGL